MALISRTVCFVNRSSVFKSWLFLSKEVLDSERFEVGSWVPLTDIHVVEAACIKGCPFPVAKDVDWAAERNMRYDAEFTGNDTLPHALPYISNLIPSQPHARLKQSRCILSSGPSHTLLLLLCAIFLVWFPGEDSSMTEKWKEIVEGGFLLYSVLEARSYKRDYRHINFQC